MALWLMLGGTPTITIGPFVDDTDGKTAETGLGLIVTDVRLSKNGGTFAAKNQATNPAHLENGFYSCMLNATDTNTTGRLTVAVSKSGALPVWHEFMVLPVQPYTALASASGELLQVDVKQWNTVAVAGALLDEIVEGAHSLKHVLRIMLAVLSGKASGLGTTTVTFRDVADSKDRISATVDTDGNRTAIGTRDGT